MVFKDPAGSKQAQMEVAAPEKQIDMSTYTTPLHKMHCLKKLLEMEYDHYVCVGNPSCIVYCDCKEKTKAFEEALVNYIGQYEEPTKGKTQPPAKPDGQTSAGADDKSGSESSDDDSSSSSEDDEEENSIPQVNINIV